VKHFLDVGAGVIDGDYRGAIGILLFNFGEVETRHISDVQKPFSVQTGDRVAQLIIERISTPVVRAVDALPDTTRGAAGFGSTGKRKLEAP